MDFQMAVQKYPWWSVYFKTGLEQHILGILTGRWGQNFDKNIEKSEASKDNNTAEVSE